MIGQEKDTTTNSLGKKALKVSFTGVNRFKSATNYSFDLMLGTKTVKYSNREKNHFLGADERCKETVVVSEDDIISRKLEYHFSFHGSDTWLKAPLTFLDLIKPIKLERSIFEELWESLVDRGGYSLLSFNQENLDSEIITSATEFIYYFKQASKLRVFDKISAELGVVYLVEGIPYQTLARYRVTSELRLGCQILVHKDHETTGARIGKDMLLLLCGFN